MKAKSSKSKQHAVKIIGKPKELAKLAEAIDNEFDWAAVEQEYGLTKGFFYDLFTALNGGEE